MMPERILLPVHRDEENSQPVPITRLGSYNISFHYLYRDASNYKQHGQAIFHNRTRLSLEEVDEQIRCRLHERAFFIARQVHIEERFFDIVYPEDHPWHEFEAVGTTTEPAFDPEHTSARDITEFIAALEQAQRKGWDESNIRPDLADMLRRMNSESR